jgi:ribonuclease-3
VLGRRPSTPLEKRLGYRFRHAELLEQALTHRSYAYERGSTAHYERLEFLGDAVLGLVAAEWLYARHPDLPEGQLSRLKSHAVSAPVLGAHAERLGVGEALRLGVGEERSGGRAKRSLLADSLEALFGAVYLDGGLKAVRPLVERALEEALADRGGVSRADAKTALQELVQGKGWDLPEYRLVAATGPDHRKTFSVDVWLRGEVIGQGEGESKKLAEQRAAAAAITRLERLAAD